MFIFCSISYKNLISDNYYDKKEIKFYLYLKVLINYKLLFYNNFSNLKKIKKF